MGDCMQHGLDHNSILEYFASMRCANTPNAICMQQLWRHNIQYAVRAFAHAGFLALCLLHVCKQLWFDSRQVCKISSVEKPIWRSHCSHLFLEDSSFGFSNMMQISNPDNY